MKDTRTIAELDAYYRKEAWKFTSAEAKFIVSLIQRCDKAEKELAELKKDMEE